MRVDIRLTLLITFLAFTFSSCITNRDLEYIRSNKELNKEKVDMQDYRLQVGDLLSVQISTTTEQQHDFFNKEKSSSQLMAKNPYTYGYLIKRHIYCDQFNGPFFQFHFLTLMYKDKEDPKTHL